MEYERIHKVESGMISPSKLRMKLLGMGYNCNSTRTSPSRLEEEEEEDSQFVHSSLLGGGGGRGDFSDQAMSKLSSQVEPVKSGSTRSDAGSARPNEQEPRNANNGDSARTILIPHGPKTDAAAGSSSASAHPSSTSEDENNLDYDSTSSFEFHKGDPGLPPHHQHPARRAPARPMPSKWNDAEKWIVGRHSAAQQNVLKKEGSHSQGSRHPSGVMVRVAPDLGGAAECRASVKKVDFVQSAVPRAAASRFGFGGAVVSSSQAVDLCPESNDLREVDDKDFLSVMTVADETAESPAVRAVSMRDTGTEMTPIPSQEPSRSTTPIDSTTPVRSPTSSAPSTPRRGVLTPTPTENAIFLNCPQPTADAERKELSEQELKERTRQEIVALGVRLGKTNIADWAISDEKGIFGNESVNGGNEAERDEYAKRAAAWEEAEKSNHMARFKREEIRFQAWECRQKARLEAKMKKIEAQLEEMKARAQAKMVREIALATQKSEEKRASAEAKRSRQAQKTATRAEYIRRTGRLPSSSFHCCGWL